MAIMIKPVVIFGTGTLSELAYYHITQDTTSNVAGFTVDRQYLISDTFMGCPVAPFEEIESVFPPSTYCMLIPMGYTNINQLRESRCKSSRERGYALSNYISPHALVWQGFEHKDNTIVFERATIQAYAQVGENVIIRSGANIGHHSKIGSNCFIASGVVTGGNVTIGNNCFIGLGAVIRDGVSIATNTFIGAGAVLISDTEENGVYVGNPARRLADKDARDVTLK